MTKLMFVTLAATVIAARNLDSGAICFAAGLWLALWLAISKR